MTYKTVSTCTYLAAGLNAKFKFTYTSLIFVACDAETVTSDVPLVRANGHFGLALALSEERFGKF